MATTASGLPPPAGDARPVFRFAPSPNGRLHLGHALSAGLNAAMAQASGGRFLLRIEDIDRERSVPVFERAIYGDLAWLGLVWEDPPRRQSEHMSTYADLLARLREEDLVYPAFMSRTEIRAHVRQAEASGAPWPRDPDGAPHYPGVERAWSEIEQLDRIASGAQFAWRLDMARAVGRAGEGLCWREWRDASLNDSDLVPARPEMWGDVILARRDVPVSYHLAVVADDALQGVSHVVRGRDLFHATAVHRLLQRLLDLPAPSYFHHRLVLGPDGSKLSKSEGAEAVTAWRERGASAEEVWDAVGLTLLRAAPHPP